MTTPRVAGAGTWIATGLTVALLLAGCGGSDAPSTKPTFGGGPPTSSTGSDDSSVAEARRAAGIQDCPPASAEPPTDQALPDVMLECLGGGEAVRLSALGGKPTVINVWASWCAPCREELPLLAEADQQTGDQVQFWGIDFSDPDPEAAIELARDSAITYPQLVDRDEKSKVGLKILGLPQTVFVDAQGRIVATERVPFRSYEDLADAIERHLGVNG